MNSNTNLKAFTILEALISLVLMGIIITLCYTVFNLIERQMTLFKNENMSVLQYNLFNTTIKNDIYNAEDFIYNDNRLLLKNYDGSNIDYQVSKRFILRHHNIKTDTFKFRVFNHKFLQSDNSKPLDKILQITIGVLGDSINTNYYLNKHMANTINNIYFNETAVTNNPNAL
ncbi:hypothetical protein [Flavivirga algicola]|uniref:Prepilin-type N-terminal cleavage/methylation domain-containing protein n=1 Tax=Flavivirga algicola TaxID=2729136 RepID=A0ABX1RTZ7_9FLAO|nr:hypothetical protein [Flavivirga algicola]NMH85974.1 hypothetical protein [Flavivirga algicola]